MFNVNGIPAVLVQNNRTTTQDDYYDDQNKAQVNIVVCPYNADVYDSFGTDTVAQAKGYFIVKAETPVREGDQIIIGGETFSVIGLKDNWIWNKIVNKTLAIK